MFTGLVEKTGKIASTRDSEKGRELVIWTGEEFLKDVKVGDSIAINGVCLTATEVNDDRFTAFASLETLSRSNLKYLKTGDEINLEKPMKPDSFFGGHIVQGHVDETGKIISIVEVGDSRVVTVQIPDPSHMKWVVEKGSIAVDGVSLTVNETGVNYFKVTIIPHTWEKTIFHTYSPGSIVNIEYDIIAKYVANTLEKMVGSDEKIKNIIENSPYFKGGG